MSNPQMSCEELDVLLCDYLDGTLTAEQKASVEAHLAVCPACAEMAQDITGTLQFIERVADVEPPAELITKIVLEARNQPSEKQSGWRRLFGRFLDPILQPRFAMSMALTFLSFAMVGKLVGIESRPLRPADLDPVKIYQNLDDAVHRQWTRAVKYYDGLKLVYEVQSRYKEWAERAEEERRRQPTAPSPTPSNDTPGSPTPSRRTD